MKLYDFESGDISVPEIFQWKCDIAPKIPQISLKMKSCENAGNFNNCWVIIFK